MAGLPRATDNTRPRDAWAIMVCGGVERMTESLRRGDPFSEKSLEDMRRLQARLQAFSDALDSRTSLVEDD